MRPSLHTVVLFSLLVPLDEPVGLVVREVVGFIRSDSQSDLSGFRDHGCCCGIGAFRYLCVFDFYAAARYLGDAPVHPGFAYGYMDVEEVPLELGVLNRP